MLSKTITTSKINSLTLKFLTKCNPIPLMNSLGNQFPGKLTFFISISSLESTQQSDLWSLWTDGSGSLSFSVKYSPFDDMWSQSFWLKLQVDHERITKTDVWKDKDDPLAKAALSSISFDLPEKVSPVRIRCRATVFTAYDQNSNVTMIHPIPRRLTGTDTLLRPGK